MVQVVGNYAVCLCQYLVTLRLRLRCLRNMTTRRNGDEAVRRPLKIYRQIVADVVVTDSVVKLVDHALRRC